MEAEKPKVHSVPATAVLRTATTNRNQWFDSIRPKRSMVDVGFTILRHVHPRISTPLLGKNKQVDVRSGQEFSETVMGLMESIVRKSPESEGKKLSELVSGRPMVISVSAERGSGKTTVTEEHLVKPLAADGIQTTVLHTDFYSHRPENHSYHGYKDNPRNSDIAALLRDIRGFKAGKLVAVRTSKYGASHKNVSALNTPVMIVEGIHALSILRVIRETDIVCALLLEPAARVVRAMKRDSEKSTAVKQLQHYIELDMKASSWWRWTGLLRIIDAHVVYKIGVDQQDLHDVGRLAGWNTDHLETMIRDLRKTNGT